jgi:hypothetical protein
MKLHGSIARTTLAAICVAAILSIAACSPYIGYGVLNWSVPEHGLKAGDVVPVYIQSNIGKVYVVGAGSDRKTRIELPLWQVSVYTSSSKAKRAARAFGEFTTVYATVKVDGLPVRAEPDNTARQVYRLRQGQKLRIVAKGEGSPVVAGNAPLEGSWYSVLTDDGSAGWCFSYNLTIFDESEEQSPQTASTEQGPDPVLEAILLRTWYPDYYRSMAESGKVDVARVRSGWGFFPGKDSLVARVELEDLTAVFPYSSIVRVEDRVYRFEGTSLIVEYRKGDVIFVQYTDGEGSNQAMFFRTLDTTPEELVSSELSRRAAVLEGIRKAGPQFASGNYGALRFLPEGRFLWSGYQLLSPSVIPEGSGGAGTVENRYFLHESLESSYDGVLTFSFETGRGAISFLYQLTGQGLKLEYVSASNVKDATVTARNLTPTVIFFAPSPGGS